jgi:hypothetical protein
VWRKILGGFLIFFVPRATILTVAFPMNFLEPEMSDQPWTEHLKFAIYFLLLVASYFSGVASDLTLSGDWFSVSSVSSMLLLK